MLCFHLFYIITQLFSPALNKTIAVLITVLGDLKGIEGESQQTGSLVHLHRVSKSHRKGCEGGLRACTAVPRELE